MSVPRDRQSAQPSASQLAPRVIPCPSYAVQSEKASLAKWLKTACASTLVGPGRLPSSLGRLPPPRGG
eukprot:15080991-Alexandrium_andersonii.AAC.1